MDFLERAAGWLGRLLDGVNPESGATRAGLLALGLLLAAVGIAWMRRISDPGPMGRGEAAWRYRDRSRFERVGEAFTLPSLPGEGETRGWWATRIEFGIAITSIALVTFLLFSLETPLHESSPLPWGLPWGVVALAAYVGMLFGLGWMVRIYRAGLRNDAQATWRHRDHRS